MRLVHISDLHFWHVTLNPVALAGKRILGMTNLILNRAWKYHMDCMPIVIGRIQEIHPDHVLITGDLTTTALEQEFRAVRAALAPLSSSADLLTIIPGNHDRYTRSSVHMFEGYFGEFLPARQFPWLKQIDTSTAIVGLDPTHPNPLSAEGTIKPEQLRAAQKLLESVRAGTRPVIACHYPVAVPDGVQEKRGHGMRGVEDLRDLLRANVPNVYCHGHIHTSWSFVPATLPGTLCLNPGAALKQTGNGRARMLEILFEGEGVQVWQHRLRNGEWEQGLLTDIPDFFAERRPRGNRDSG